MHLREGESILKVYHHHPTPFVITILKLVIGTMPFFLFIFFLQGALSAKVFFLLHLAVFVVFSLIVTYFALIYWLDKLVITNQRVVYVNWKYLTIRDESEALLTDIQDIQTHEKGVFSYFWILDYGFFMLETASAHTTIRFQNAPDPEGIRRYVYHVRQQ